MIHFFLSSSLGFFSLSLSLSLFFYGASIPTIARNPPLFAYRLPAVSPGGEEEKWKKNDPVWGFKDTYPPPYTRPISGWAVSDFKALFQSVFSAPEWRISRAENPRFGPCSPTGRGCPLQKVKIK